MRNDDGSYVNPELNSREAVMMYAAKRIPQLKSRQNKGDQDHNQQQQYASQHSTASGNCSSKKKSKRR